MIQTLPIPPGPDLRRKLLWLMGVRVFLGTALLGSAVYFKLAVGAPLPVNPFFFLIGLTYALTLIYALVLPWTQRHPWLVDLQLAGDVMLVSAFIYVTGGITSVFSTLYVLPIIAASIIQFRRGSVLAAIFSAVLYAGLISAQYLQPGFIEGVAVPASRVAGYTVALNVFGFFAVARLSSSLSESLRRADVRLQEASHELADLQAFNQHVIDSLTGGLVTTDRAGHVLTVNRGASQITGQPTIAMLGRHVGPALQLPPEFVAQLDDVLVTAGVRRLEYSYGREDGRRLEIGLTAAPLVTPGGRAGFVLAFQDVTEVRRLQREVQLKQRLAAVGEMAAGIAHEIRNPLASMSGSIQVLRQELPLSQEQANLMDIVLRESERLNETINSFLAYARPTRFAIKPIDLRSVVLDTAVLLRNSSEVHPEHVVDTDCPDHEVPYEADSNQIKQIVWNLATNGLRAMPDGGRLTIGLRVEGHGAAVLSVRDEGIGIPSGELDEVFQPFRGNFTRGTGLGLAIVHRIVSDYNGEIRIRSNSGRGTEVIVRLPAKVEAITA